MNGIKLSLGAIVFVVASLGCNGHDPSNRESDLYKDRPELEGEYKAKPPKVDKDDVQKKAEELERLKKEAEAARDEAIKAQEEASKAAEEKMAAYKKKVDEQQSRANGELQKKMSSVQAQYEKATKKIQEANAMIAEIEEQKRILSQRVEHLEFSFSTNVDNPADESLVFTVDEQREYALVFQVPKDVKGELKATPVAGLSQEVQPKIEKSDIPNQWQLKWTPSSKLFLTNVPYKTFLLKIEFQPMGKVSDLWQHEDKERVLKLVVVNPMGVMTTKALNQAPTIEVNETSKSEWIELEVFDPQGDANNQPEFWQAVVEVEAADKRKVSFLADPTEIRVDLAAILLKESAARGANWSVPLEVIPSALSKNLLQQGLVGEVLMKVKILIVGANPNNHVIQNLKIKMNVADVQGVQ